MSQIEVPQYFLCPISLEIMKEPVTTVTGITYDRESIEKWLLKAKNCACPVTKQPLPRSSEYLTPNHTLQRLIQAWISSNESKGIDLTPSSKSPLEKIHVEKLVRDLEIPNCYETTLKKLHDLAKESERNRMCMVEVGVPKVMVMIINKSFKEGKILCLEESIRILHLLWYQACNMKPHLGENLDFIKSLTWILQVINYKNVKMVNEVMTLLKLTIEVADSTPLGGLTLEFFIEIVRVLRKRALLSQQAIKSALHVLIEACSLGRNRTRVIEAGAVTELIEIELEKPEKNLTELIFNLLAHLCSCAEGREQFLSHAAGIAVVSKRILRVSHATDDRAIHILSVIAKYSGSYNNEVVVEMLRVGAVSKLCMVMQADCASYLKEKARAVLRLHSNVWNNSPCIHVYLFTRHQR